MAARRLPCHGGARSRVARQRSARCRVGEGPGWRVTRYRGILRYCQGPRGGRLGERYRVTALQKDAGSRAAVVSRLTSIGQRLLQALVALSSAPAAAEAASTRCSSSAMARTAPLFC
jgi:hypothetical protein